MPNWIIDGKARTASLDIFGGTLVVTRGPTGLNSVWKSDALPQHERGFCTGLEHVGWFAIPPAAVRLLEPTVGIAMLRAKWEGPHRTWAAQGETPAMRAFEMRLHGWRGMTEALDLEDNGVAKQWAQPDPYGAEGVSWIPGAACWLAPVAIRVHLQHVEPKHFRQFAADAPPSLVVRDTDPI